MSCGAACVRQLLLDAEIDIAEATIRSDCGFDPVNGIEGIAIVQVLEKHLAPRRYRSGAVLPTQLGLLARSAPFLVLVRAPWRHWIIVDAVAEEYIHVRDPAGLEATNVGLQGVIQRGAFLERWRRATNGAVFRVV